MSRNLDLDLVRTFVAVADSGSMTVAANLLHMTQGAVSQQVKRLEDVLDCLLFVRKTRRLELSHQGEQFLVKARKLLRLNDEIWADMTGQPLRGALRVGVPYDLVTRLAPAMKAFAEAHPHVEISLVCAASPELSEAVNSGRVDVSLVEYVASEAEGEVVCIEPLVWVKGRGSDAWQKRPLPLSMVDERCAFRPVVLGALADEGIAWRTVFESGNIEATAATVRAGLAITAWLASTVPADLETLTFRVSGLPALPPFAICLRLPATVQPAALEFARHVRDSMSSDAGTRRAPLANIA
ncbi:MULTISPECIES: LysR substrate-binding domain-containing protein [unclassified Paraburkholderia]|uniref:LysR substrate-binding domain-containing protein n=1 Tax=unclassified Paraburkholderia TaxID=2615204 RepID=UPI001610BB78|nr:MULTISPECIES: LysR substrate-binding domain-containing protein [unclassified Paraburkholderia]MBB5446854.1 DNA-binding transcriptional LysR family regulator [Paraburkholderia sp. WSM4177]MBB5487494.1 DNA-binding transcriptional LysR family regulator [Paraburkholderia sp. WSM4180]